MASGDGLGAGRIEERNRRIKPCPECQGRAYHYLGCRSARLTPSADLPACRDEDPAHATTLTACYPDPPGYQHPEDDDG